ncbi:hypothetical protein [Streptomyces sp. NPDC059928]|uniref:hypothetical protein n=1 Tax=unclassified Streptomyces TaxID=2593676 RepID=UPI00364FE8E6
MKGSTQLRWALRNGVWAFGAASVADYIRRTADYTLDGVAQLIDCPTLIPDGENDQFFHGQPQRVQAALTCPNTLLTLTEAEGAGEHCHMEPCPASTRSPSTGSTPPLTPATQLTS